MPRSSLAKSLAPASLNRWREDDGMLVRIMSDDWNTFGQVALVIEETPRPGSTMMWVRLSDGTMMAVANHEVEVINDRSGEEHGPRDRP